MPAGNPRFDELPMSNGRVRQPSSMSGQIADYTGRNNIVGPVTSTVLAGEQMFCGALEAPYASRLQA